MLVVDDEALIRWSLSEALADSGWSVQQASNGAEARRILGALPSDPLVVVSNRGPVSFRRDADGTLEAVRGAGGLVAALAPLADRHDVVWVASAMGDADREVAVMRAEATRVREETTAATHELEDLQARVRTAREESERRLETMEAAPADGPVEGPPRRGMTS